MTDLPMIPKSAVAVLNRAGISTLEDFSAWSENVRNLRGFGPKAFETIVAAMQDAGLEFDPASTRNPDAVNRQMAEERMAGAPPDPSGPTDLPNIGKPALRALAAIGVHTMADLAGHSEEELLGLHGFGPKAMRLLKEAGAQIHH